MTIPAPVPSPSGAAARLARALTDLPGRSPDPNVCPFLRLETGEGLAAPAGDVDDGHRCVAGAAPYVPSPLQQQLVCLTAGHVACPRYTKGIPALAAATGQGGVRVGLPTSIRLAALAVVVIFVGAWPSACCGARAARRCRRRPRSPWPPSPRPPVPR